MKQFTMLMIAALMGVYTLAAAQPPEKGSPAWWAKVAEQTIRNVQSPNPDIQVIALKNVIILTTLHRDKLDVSGAVAPIIGICESNAKARSIALAALQAIGSEEALAYLAAHADMDAEHPAEVIATVLKEHYAKKSTAML